MWVIDLLLDKLADSRLFEMDVKRKDARIHAMPKSYQLSICKKLHDIK